MSHDIEDGNDSTDGVKTMRNYHLLVIRVRDNIYLVHVVEHDLIGFALKVMEVMWGFQYYGVDWF